MMSEGSESNESKPLSKKFFFFFPLSFFSYSFLKSQLKKQKKAEEKRLRAEKEKKKLAIAAAAKLKKQQKEDAVDISKVCFDLPVNRSQSREGKKFYSIDSVVNNEGEKVLIKARVDSTRATGKKRYFFFTQTVFFNIFCQEKHVL